MRGLLEVGDIDVFKDLAEMNLDLTGQPYHTHCAFCTDLSAWCDCVDDDVYICVSPGVKNT